MLAQSGVDEKQRKSKRKRGAPPGNLNALKHGRYTREARARKPAPVSRAKFEDIDQHILFIQKFMRHLYEVGMHSTDLDQTLHLLTSYSLAAFALTRMLRLREKNLSADASVNNLESALMKSLSAFENGSK